MTSVSDLVIGFGVIWGVCWFLKSFNNAVVQANNNIKNKSGRQTGVGFDWGSGGYCTQVYDGNYIKCRVDGKDVVVRLFGMNAPEEGQYGKPSQPFAREATAFLAKKIHNAWVGIIPTETDKFARTIGRVLLDEEDVALTMLKMGFAKVCIANLKEPFLTEYTRAEEEAKRQRLGLWSQGTTLEINP